MRAVTLQKWASAAVGTLWKPTYGTSRLQTQETKGQSSVSQSFKLQHQDKRILWLQHQ